MSGKISIPHIVFDHTTTACNGLATLDIPVSGNSVTLVQVIGNMRGYVPSGTDLGNVKVYGDLERKVTTGYADPHSTDDVQEWAKVAVGGCQVRLVEGGNTLMIVTPGTYRIRLSAPDLENCLKIYYEEISETAHMRLSSVPKY